MNITIFNRDYLMRRYEADGVTYSEKHINIHLHEDEHGSGQWPETQGTVRTIAGHGMEALREADLEAGTKGDRVFFCGRWYECVSSVLYDRTVLSHYNYRFVVTPEDAIDVITIFNPVYNEETGMDTYEATVIRGVSWVSSLSANTDTAGLQSNTTCVIRIPEDADFSGKTYVEPELYEGQEGTFTFMTGDTVVHGEETELTTLAELHRKYKPVITVLTVTDNRKAPNARHWKLEGQ